MKVWNRPWQATVLSLPALGPHCYWGCPSVYLFPSLASSVDPYLGLPLCIHGPHMAGLTLGFSGSGWAAHLVGLSYKRNQIGLA